MINLAAAIRTTEYLLSQWGRWAYHRRGLRLDYPSADPCRRMARERQVLIERRDDALPEPDISDDDAFTIDRAVSELAKKRPLEHDALALYYLQNGITYRELGRQLNTHHAIAASMVANGRAFVDGWLLSKAAEL